MSRRSYQQLIDSAAGDLVPGAPAVSPSAARTSALYRLVSQVIRDDAGAEPPPASVAAARAVFRPAPAAAGLLDRAAAVLQEVLGRLVFDSRVQPALAGAGLRGAATAFHAAWVLDDADVDVQVEAEADGRMRLRGQVTEADGPSGPQRVELCRGDAAAPVAATDTDDRGVFSLSVPRGTYRLRVHRRAGIAVLPDLNIP